MPADPFRIEDAERVREHPDTPSAYVDWSEFLSLLCRADRTHLGNLLGWSYPDAACPLGASRETFERAFPFVGEDTLDRWMVSLARTPIEDFVDHHVPFMRNIASVKREQVPALVSRYLDLLDGSGEHAGENTPAKKMERTSPEVVHLEITRSCNFACTMCSSRTGGFLPGQTMPLEMFGEFVRVLGPNAKTIRVNGYGESTIVPGIASYLDCLDEFEFAGLREIITNLSGPNHVFDDLVDRGFVVITSWDSTRPEVFEAIRIGANYNELLGRLRRVGALLAPEPERLVLLCTVQERNMDEVPLLVDHAADVGAGVLVFNMVNEDDGSPWMEDRFDDLSDLLSAALDRGREVGVTVQVPDHLGSRRLRLKGVTRSSARFCDRPWVELMVRWDGEATVCNMFNPFSYGTLVPGGPPRDMPSRLKRLWNGPNAKLFRRMINSASPHPYCEDCYFLHGRGG